MSNLEKAQTALQEAQANREKWQAALEDAEARETVILAQTPGAPDDLDGVADEQNRAAARIAAAQRGVDAADQTILTAHENIVRAGAEDERDAAKKARRAADTHRQKVRGLLDQLTTLDGVGYRPMGEQDARAAAEPGEPVTWRRSKLHQLESEARSHELVADVLAYMLDRREIPVGGFQIGQLLTENETISQFVPDYALEWVDALRGAGVPTTADEASAAHRAEADAERAREAAAEPPRRRRIRALLSGPRSTGVLGDQRTPAQKAAAPELGEWYEC